MPDEIRDLLRYANYFSKTAPSTERQTYILVLIGIITGIVSVAFTHATTFPQQYFELIVYGGSSGILVVSLPALLTVALLKVMKRRLRLKHIMLATLFSAAFYSMFLVITTAAFALFGSYTAAYIIIILGNASIYAYWLIINKVLMGKQRAATLIAATQPVLNVFLYIPLGKYILNLSLPVGVVLTKLFAGMLIFLAVGYIFLYTLDRPVKREIDMSGVQMFTIMLNELLYNFNPDSSGNFPIGVERNISVDILALRDRSGEKRVMFVNPGIHFGPFSGFGGAVATEHLGNLIHRKYNATPFILHGALNIANNPISTSQVYRVSKHIEGYMSGVKDSWFRPARGGVRIARSGVCKAINLRINDCRMISLTKAPTVTEDIDHRIGGRFRRVASADGKQAIIIDAHNSRVESASKDELRGVYLGSAHARTFEKAIKDSIQKESMKPLRFGASQLKLEQLIRDKKDLGKGFTSFCVFDFSGKRFGMLYFDVNNILPKMREELISHVRRKYNIGIEVYTTDTHAVNSLALPSSNVLGRHTTIDELLPHIDDLARGALSNMADAYSLNANLTIKKFRVWGEDAEAQITKASRDAIRMAKYVAPFVIAAGFILAAWIIYSV